MGARIGYHILAEVMKRAYADRSKHLGRHGLLPDVPFSLMAKEYSSFLNKGISVNSRTASKDVFAGDPYRFHESPDHVSFLSDG